MTTTELPTPPRANPLGATEIDGLLRAASQRIVRQELAVERRWNDGFVWVTAAGVCGAVLGLVTGGLIVGGLAGALVGGVLGYVATLTFAVAFWNVLPAGKPSAHAEPAWVDPADDDLLDSW
jgi:hypothetical protein